VKNRFEEFADFPPMPPVQQVERSDMVDVLQYQGKVLEQIQSMRKALQDTDASELRHEEFKALFLVILQAQSAQLFSVATLLQRMINEKDRGLGGRG